MWKHDEIVGACGTVFGSVSTALQTNETLQIIQAGLTIIGLIVTISYTLWKWWKKASKDGKITIEEVEELMENLKDNSKEDE